MPGSPGNFTYLEKMELVEHLLCVRLDAYPRKDLTEFLLKEIWSNSMF